MNKKIPAFLIFGFLAFNLVMAYFMPIQEDEAYYWMYGQNLDWGYFDHPPMVALMIKIGTSFFGGELGTRLLTTILSLLTCLVIWRMVPSHNKTQNGSLTIFLLIALSIPLMHVYGFITTPDVPLLFFSSLYLLYFQKFLNKTTYINAIKLGIVAALLLFSKYHGVLVIFFALLPNLKLFKKTQLYIAGLTGLLFFLPHLIWQYQNDFVTFRYHLSGRVENVFLWENVLTYIANSLLVLNPVFAGLIIYRSFRKYQYPFKDKTLLFVFWGGIIFFAFSSFRDHVEPHWITFTVIPLIIMVYHFSVKSEKTMKLVLKTAYLTIGLIVILRFVLILPLPYQKKIHKYHSEYFFEIDSIAGNANVAYLNSYPKAAMHTFYTGSPAFSFNCMPYGKKQYDYWNYEDSFHNKEAFLVSDWHSVLFDATIMKTGHELYFHRTSHLPVISKTEIEVINIDKTIKIGEDNIISLEIYNPNDFDLQFQDGSIPISINIYFRYHGGRYYAPLENHSLDILKPHETQTITGSFKPNIPPGKYRLFVTLKPGNLYDVALTPAINVTVVD